MGADGNLIRAAGQMGPKAWDYSGIIRAIEAIGKYTAHKRAVASELTSWGDQNIKHSDSIPEELENGNYGDQNTDFLIDKKKQWKNARKIIGNPLIGAGSKKYKNAVKTINNIKKILEKNKADVIIWNDMWNKRSEYFTKMSKGTPFSVEDKMLDLAMDGGTKSLSSNLAYTDSGLVVATPEGGIISVRDYLNGYEENRVTGDIQNKISGIINKWGKTSADGGDPEFLDNKARDDFRALFTLMKKDGFAGIRSIAYDYQGSVKDKNQSYIQANGEYITGMTDEEWVKIASEVRDDGSIPTADEISVMKEQVSAWAFDASNQNDLEAKMTDWFVGLAEADFDSSREKPKLREGGSLKLGWTGSDNTAVYLKPEALPTITKGIKERKTFLVDGTRFKYLNEQWIWDANGDFEPVKGAEGQNYNYKDGSDKALLYRLGDHPAIAEALGLSNNSQVIINNDENEQTAKSDTTTTLPILQVDSTQIDSTQS